MRRCCDLVGHFVTVEQRFTERLGEAIAAAGAEARELGHATLTDGHLLLGLLHLRHGVAARVLKRHGAALKTSHAAMRTRPGQTLTPDQPTLDATATRALNVALYEALERVDESIRAAYLLCALCAVEGEATSLMRAQQVDPARVADDTHVALRPPDPSLGGDALEARLGSVKASMAGAARSEDVRRAVAGARDRPAAVSAVASVLQISPEEAQVVTSMPFYALTAEQAEELATERRDLEERLAALRQGRPPRS